MKNRQRGFGEIFFVILLMIVVFGIGFIIQSASCSRQWKRSGLSADWGPIQGCLVQISDGRWLPAENLRGGDLIEKKTNQ